jgi:hypothetical protein
MNGNFFSGWFLYPLFMIVIISGCTTVSKQYEYSSTSSITITEKELLSGKAIFGKALLDADLPEENVISLTTEMKNFLEKNVLNTNGAEARARKLSKALFDDDKLGMSYNFSRTYTASEAFANKTGNCLAFSYLFAAFAKESGLKVAFQEVEIPPEWDSVSDDLLMTSRHVNVRLLLRGRDDLTIDINRVGIPAENKVNLLNEDRAVALY